uniref:Uncharacterized protein n=1 Tax=Triticum urartu TaxID=4572 RepID=A0A8R7V4Y0_TRIUA
PRRALLYKIPHAHLGLPFSLHNRRRRRKPSRTRLQPSFSAAPPPPSTWARCTDRWPVPGRSAGRRPRSPSRTRRSSPAAAPTRGSSTTAASSPPSSASARSAAPTPPRSRRAPRKGSSFALVFLSLLRKIMMMEETLLKC